ncbi:Leo1-like protein-domain-containing protein [Schizophyllum fasciatum]
MSNYGENMDALPSEAAHGQDVDMNASELKEEEREHVAEQSADEGGADDLFGEEEDEAPASPSGASDRLPTPERERRHALEYTEDVEAQDNAPVALKEADVSLPNLPLPRSSDGSTWVVRMPNFLTLDTKPFHPDTYEGPENEMAHSAASIREQSLSIKLKVENTIRWRWAKNSMGEDVRQSNSRIIRWSDGSLSLRLGKELFDIQQTVDNSAATTRQTMGGASSQRATQGPPAQPTRPQGLTYLVAQHKHSQVLQSETPITGFMSLTPSDMQSESHRLLVSAVSQKRNKSVRVRMAPDPTVDPEREKAELIRQDAKKTKRTRSEPRSRRSRRTDDMWSDDDEEEGYAYDEDGGGRRGGGHKKAGRTKDDTGGGDYQEDDFVVADESEEEEEPSSKRRRNDDDEDALDRAERELERRNRDERRQGARASPQQESDEGEEAMDVESEEEEDRIRLRRTDSRRRVQIEEEEEE